jgi:hypothetical protein
MVYTHRNKSEATYFILKALNFIKVQFGKEVRFIRLDGERSLGNAFDDMVSERGIKVEITALDTPAQNGGAERAGRIIIIKARTMRIAAQLPANLWPETVKASGYISNRTPVKKLNWKTPFELVKNYKPRLGHLHVFRCKAYSLKQPKELPKKAKLDPRAHIGYLVGYDSTNIMKGNKKVCRRYARLSRLYRRDRGIRGSGRESHTYKTYINTIHIAHIAHSPI